MIICKKFKRDENGKIKTEMEIEKLITFHKEEVENVTQEDGGEIKVNIYHRENLIKTIPFDIVTIDGKDIMSNEVAKACVEMVMKHKENASLVTLATK